MSVKRALIIGISGQDGPYLAKHLLGKGYRVFGTSRNHLDQQFENLQTVGIAEGIDLLPMSPLDRQSVQSGLDECNPDEVYNLSGPSSVGRSFEFPEETQRAIVVGTKNILDCLRAVEKPVRLFNTASSECYGNTPTPASENTPFNPVSPYASAKAEAFSLVRKYREQYGVLAYSGILFNHESPLRPVSFVTRKIINGVVSIATGQQDKLVLGNLDVIRDWGWAPEYTEAMWRILQHDKPDDFIVATGQSCSLREVVETAFDQVGLDWGNYVETDEKFMRPTDIAQSRGNPKKAASVLGWQATVSMPEVIGRMIKVAKSEIH